MNPFEDFINMTAVRYEKDRTFRLRLLSETDETARETAQRIRRDDHVAALRRTA